MGHFDYEEYLERENIDLYLNALAEEIIESGIGEHSILIVGGAAMALKVDDGRATVDIDIAVKEQHNLYMCCMAVAERYKLPEDWINTDVMHSDSFSYELFADAFLYKRFKEILSVYLVSDLDLYCMKMVSFRPKDVQDLSILAERLRSYNVSVNRMRENFVRLYGDEFLLMNDERKLRFAKKQLEG